MDNNKMIVIGFILGFFIFPQLTAVTLIIAVVLGTIWEASKDD